MEHHTRRNFLKTGTLAGSGFLLAATKVSGLGTARVLDTGRPLSGQSSPTDPLVTLSQDLLQQWTESLVSLQIDRPGNRGLHGGILCPACSTVHGRCGDTIFPLLYLASVTGERKYVKSALSVYEWMEINVSLPDGSWVNEVNASDWKGTTVFGATSLAEALLHFGHLLDSGTRNLWRGRLKAAADYVDREFTITTGNINYPIHAAYALTLIGNLLNQPAYITRGRELARQSLAYFTPTDRLIYGEGHPTPTVSKKGCYSVDLGYNVEESLPALVLYAKLTGDTEVLEAVKTSMHAHLEFMLPDGAWDNSWGTRNFKWTYWGSRTSDGCQPAYALMADADPVFYEAALRNTRQLQGCTHDGLLYGGPGYLSHGVLPCVHHLFGHSKALATILIHRDQWTGIKRPSPILLPREKPYGIRYFKDIDTHLISHGAWKGTFTGYDVQYTMKAGHASGQALSALWHEKIGPVIMASMNRYQLVERANMQRDRALNPMCLTPRMETVRGGETYTNLNDFQATLHIEPSPGGIGITTRAHLRDENQQPVPDAPTAEINYQITEGVFQITTHLQGTAPTDRITYLLPVISKSGEKLTVRSPREITIDKSGGVLQIVSDHPLELSGKTDERAFNFVPGMEALVLKVPGGTARISLSVI